MAVAVVNYNDEATVPAGLGLDLLEVGFSTDTRVSVYVLGRKQKEKAKKIPTRLHTTRTHARTIIVCAALQPEPPSGKH